MAAVSSGAELASLALAAHLSLGNFEQAEARAHHSLTLLQPHMQRDRALNTVRLAHAQLGQTDFGPAVATAMSVPAGLVARHPRVATLISDFGTKLRITAPSSRITDLWHEYAHTCLANIA